MITAIFLSLAISAPLPDLPPDCTMLRNKRGVLVRSSKPIREFKIKNVCPSTGRKGAYPCPGYEVDHICPLRCGGYDHIDNLQWLTRKENRNKGVDCSKCTPDNQRSSCRW